jgi:hypothetical protein
MADATAANESLQGLYFSYQVATSDKWRTVTRDAGGVTVRESRVTVAQNTWYLLEIRQVESKFVQFFVNGVEVVHQHSTNMPVSLASPCFAIQSTAVGARTLQIDYTRARSVLLKQRWS